jgi:hypothetical protein
MAVVFASFTLRISTSGESQGGNSNTFSNQEKIISPRKRVFKAETEFRREFTIMVRGKSAFYLPMGPEILIDIALNLLDFETVFHPGFFFISMYKSLNCDLKGVSSMNFLEIINGLGMEFLVITSSGLTVFQISV